MGSYISYYSQRERGSPYGGGGPILLGFGEPEVRSSQYCEGLKHELSVCQASLDGAGQFVVAIVRVWDLHVGVYH